MRRKDFPMASGKYYFNIKNGQSNITISRDKRRDAENAFNNYISVGKTCEWLGMWNGKKFEDSTLPAKASV